MQRTLARTVKRHQAMILARVGMEIQEIIDEHGALAGNDLKSKAYEVFLKQVEIYEYPRGVRPQDVKMVTKSKEMNGTTVWRKYREIRRGIVNVINPVFMELLDKDGRLPLGKTLDDILEECRVEMYKKMRQTLQEKGGQATDEFSPIPPEEIDPSDVPKSWTPTEWLPFIAYGIPQKFIHGGRVHPIFGSLLLTPGGLDEGAETDAMPSTVSKGKKRKRELEIPKQPKSENAPDEIQRRQIEVSMEQVRVDDERNRIKRREIRAQEFYYLYLMCPTEQEKREVFGQYKAFLEEMDTDIRNVLDL
mmetsp:Transcript_9994/g.17123  ORF Transcript_9994/g.17123 Transcript_9994/m.17123 type:complete len:305 (-) Transcript_9994:201-1115(-)|eukprot:CAMPEP_0184706112 /NCGR_PEP_ID=MMETSP0313-20130426/36583_1 /TAXON_ID=2792 /ORGANISM="Porphyridium aerugineum, Strain SAG 1380-2" /LENGTH=304 /DNA_ID=CAMNT_0027167653 /DNA_START=311 /DNA_END=1225 /DNA_ORIENTATION=+